MEVRPSEKNSAELIGITARPISIIFLNDFLSNGKNHFFFVFGEFFFAKKNLLSKKLLGGKKKFSSEFLLDSPFVSPLGACFNFENWSTPAVAMA